jgi:hypothetical protein
MGLERPCQARECDYQAIITWYLHTMDQRLHCRAAGLVPNVRSSKVTMNSVSSGWPVAAWRPMLNGKLLSLITPMMLRSNTTMSSIVVNGKASSLPMPTSPGSPGVEISSGSDSRMRSSAGVFVTGCSGPCSAISKMTFTRPLHGVDVGISSRENALARKVECDGTHPLLPTGQTFAMALITRRMLLMGVSEGLRGPGRPALALHVFQHL